uniref:VWFA domain-containing protein n=1 Tax=Panagrolaimus sp. PS1159 TaxID=55785 RepID=A0AC35G7I0_9BILA
MTRIFIILLNFVTSFVSADDPYIPCQSYISFSYDDSSYISETGFKKQMNFIKSAIGSLNYPARLRAEGGYGGEFSWNSGLSLAQMQLAIDAAEQAFLSYSLLQQFSSLATSLEGLNDYNNNFGAIIFISDTSDSALINADRLFSKLKGIRLTFVLLGPKAFSTNLRNFTSNFLYWQDLSQSAPDNWDLILYHAYGCGTSSSTKPISTTTKITVPTSPPAPGTSVPTPASTISPIFPRIVDIVFILDDTNCDVSYDISSQKNTISYVLQNYTIGFDGVMVANPHSIGSASFSYLFLTDLSVFTDSYLLDCSQLPDKSFTIDKALRTSMSFAYKYTRNTAEALIFVVFTLNNGTSLTNDDHGFAINASLAYRNKCMNPGNVGIIQINPGPGTVNPELGNYFFKYDDPDLYNKFLNAILLTGFYNENSIPASDCIDPIHSSV